MGLTNVTRFPSLHSPDFDIILTQENSCNETKRLLYAMNRQIAHEATSPVFRSCWLFCHLRRTCKFCKYTSRHRSQNMLERYWTFFNCDMYMSLMLWKSTRIKSTLKSFCVNNIDGLIITGSVEIGHIGLEFMIAVTSHINVHNTSCVSSLVLVLRRRALRIFLAIPIILSHDPAICDAWGGLNVHL